MFIKINNKEYGVSSCYENIGWTGEKKQESISINVVDVNAKDEFSNLVGKPFESEIMNGNGNIVLSISKDYILKDIFRDISNPFGGFSVRLEKKI